LSGTRSCRWTRWRRRGVSDRDAALAHAIYDAAVRRWLTISYLAGLHLRQPWDGLEPGVLGALLGGAAQVLFFDRVPTHSAIDEAVEWAKQAVNPRAGGLVNAVLRRIAEMVVRDGAGEPEKRDCWKGGRDELPLADGTALVLRGEPLPQDDVKRIAVATGVPPWQVREVDRAPRGRRRVAFGVALDRGGADDRACAGGRG
jgi:hypothetical protein